MKRFDLVTVMSNVLERPSGRLVEYEEAAAIIAEKNAEILDKREQLIEADKLALEHLKLLGEYANLKEQLRASNEALVAAEARIAELHEGLIVFEKEAESYGKTWAECHIADYDRIAVDSKKLRFDLLGIARDRLKAFGQAITRTDNLTALAEHDAKRDKEVRSDEREAIITLLLDLGALEDGAYIEAIRGK